MVRTQLYARGYLMAGLVAAAAMLSFAPARPPPRTDGRAVACAARSRPRALASGDADRDGLADDEESALAARYAPVVVLDPGDRYRPASVDWLLARLPAGGASPRDRLAAAFGHPRAALPEALRTGSADPRDWVSYVHVYPRADGGINLQYWFFYPYNDGFLFPFDHDGDWEHVTVHLDEERRPRELMLAQHGNTRPGAIRAWESLTREGDHPMVLSARGGHASYPDGASAPWFERVSPCVRLAGCGSPIWRTWQAGGLVNIGERGALFDADGAFAYDGRWGSDSSWFRVSGAPHSPPYQRRSFQSAGFD
ncbi:MAG TPA: hypothetical protein VKZ18_19260 [Polyangia bacterium]|nr:hypothetical protein [Polyangia bacterium]